MYDYLSMKIQIPVLSQGSTAPHNLVIEICRWCYRKLSRHRRDPSLSKILKVSAACKRNHALLLAIEAREESQE